MTIKEDLHNESDAVLGAQSILDSRQYIDMMSYMEGDPAYALIEDSNITPEERTGLFFMRSRIAELSVKEQMERVMLECYFIYSE